MDTNQNTGITQALDVKPVPATSRETSINIGGLSIPVSNSVDPNAVIPSVLNFFTTSFTQIISAIILIVLLSAVLIKSSSCNSLDKYIQTAMPLFTLFAGILVGRAASR